MRKMQKESEKVYKKTIKRIRKRVQGKNKMPCTFFLSKPFRHCFLEQICVLLRQKRKRRK